MRTYRNPIDELFTPGQHITARATTPLTRGMFVTVTEGEPDMINVTVAKAGERAFGLAQLDAEANTLVGIQRGNARCFLVPTTATISAGQLIQVGENGQPEAHTDGEVVAQALHATTNGEVALTLI